MTPRTIHTQQFYRSEDLRSFSNNLAAFTAYASLVHGARSKAKTFDALARALRQSRKLRAARSAACRELQSIYNHVAFALHMPKLPVRLPLRKRPYNRGAAVAYNSGRYEIRLYAFRGPHNKKHNDWQSADLGITKPSFLCEILLHEVAHIHQWFFCGFSEHDEGFVESYIAVERVMLNLGFGPQLPHEFRLCGCPPGSAAARLQGSPRPPSTEALAQRPTKITKQSA